MPRDEPATERPPAGPRFAELWLIEDWGKFDFDAVVEQMARLWANAIGLREPGRH